MQCVGYAEGLYFPLDGNIIFPLMVYGNTSGEMLTFKLHNQLTNEYIPIDEEYIFSPDMQLGDGLNPVVLNNGLLPSEYTISAAYPNPFNPIVNFDIHLGSEHYVDARVYNLSGQEVALIYNGKLSANKHTLNWIAENQASGIYFIQVLIDGVPEFTNKITLLK